MQGPLIVGQQPSLLTQYLSELRDEQVQQDRLRFRANIERASAILAYEVSRLMRYTPQVVTTPLGSLEVPVLAQQPVLAAILRAALPMQQGFLQCYDQADCAFISAYRSHTSDIDFEVKVEYLATPSLAGRSLIMLDPMIATGRSMLLSYQLLEAQAGKPERLFIVGMIASEEGLDYLQRHLPEAVVVVGAVDSELTAQAYIVPGLGDAGDLAYGLKGS